MTESLHAWRELYDGVARFRALAPWQWIEESQVVGVRDPQSGEVNYCSVSGDGRRGRLLVHLGSAGLCTFGRLLTAPSDEAAQLTHSLLSCLHVWFGSKKEVPARQRERLEQLGLSFRGGNYPILSVMEPGYYPDPMPDRYRDYLLTALPVLLDALDHMREEPHPYGEGPDSSVLVFSCAESSSGAPWRHAWEDPDEWHGFPTGTVDEVLVQRLRRSNRQRRGTWEVGLFVAPVVEPEGERYRYAWGLLVTCPTTGFIVGTEVFPASPDPTDARQAMLHLLDRAELWPELITISEIHAARVLEPLVVPLNLTVKFCDEMPMFDFIVRDVLEHLGVKR